MKMFYNIDASRHYVTLDISNKLTATIDPCGSTDISAVTKLSLETVSLCL
jgi:hypothetical protein